MYGKRMIGSAIGKSLIAVLLATIMTLFFWFMQPVDGFFVHAAGDYITDSYDIEAEITENHVIKVKETITVDFGESPHHGIYRYIPYSERLYVVKNIDVNGEPADFSTEFQGDNSFEVMKIGDPDTIITGKKTYVISYDLLCYKDQDTKFDYLSFDMFPTDWTSDVKSMKSRLKLPKTMDWSMLRFKGGAYGSTDFPEHFSKKIDQASGTIIVTGDNVAAKSGLTVHATLPEGYWVNPASRDFALNFIWLVIIGLPLIVIALWLAFGRDPKIVKTVEFYPPDGMTPGEIGYIVDGVVDKKDIGSMMMYFASKGYLKIEEYARDSFKLHKLRDIPESEKRFARTLFKGIFNTSESVMLDKMPSSFGDSLISAKGGIENQFAGKKNRLYSGKADVARAISIVIMIIATAVTFAISRYAGYDTFSIIYVIAPLAIQIIGILMINRAFDKLNSTNIPGLTFKFALGMIFIGVAVGITGLSIYINSENNILMASAYMLSAVISVIFIMLMRARTKKCAEWMGKIFGFRYFIKTAEYDRIKMLADEDPQYFFKILPYAYVMGMATQWAKKFADIKMEQPEWFESSYGSPDFITPMWYSSMMRSYAGNVAEQFQTAYFEDIKADFSESSSSFGGGFGGGGFSGGGFGGGGGGAW